MVGTRNVHEILGGAEGRLVTPQGRDRLTPLAAALTVGVMAGWSWPWLPAWALLATAGASALALVIGGRRIALRWRVAVLLAGTAAFGAAWPIVRHYCVADNDLARFVQPEPHMARLRGVVTSTPQLRQPAGGSMKAFNAQPPWIVFELDAKALVDRHGTPHDVSSRVWVNAPSDSPSLHPGDVVEIVGTLRTPPQPKNPGQFDIWRFARAHNQSALMSVENPALTTVMLSNPTPSLWFTRMRDALRARATSWLNADMPDSFRNGDPAERQAVLQTFLIGERAPELHEIGLAMQRTGLAHILAISGVHLAMLVAMVLFVIGAARAPRRWHGVVAIALVLGYLVLVEVRVPVLRAGVMVVFASLGLVLGRRIAVSGLVSFSLIAMLLVAPAEVTSAGFQLSFGVVYAIIYLSKPLRARWFGYENSLAGSTGTMLVEWLKTSLCVSVVAWLVATPIVLFHFGILSPLGVPLSVVGVPAAGAVLGLGYLKIILSAFVPAAGLVVGAVLAWLTDLLIVIILWIDTLPFASVSLPMPGVVWTLLAVAWVIAVVHARQRRTTRWVWTAGLALALWLCAPMAPALPFNPRPPLRIDMLAVGDGSCYVLRSAGETVVFDAGTIGDPGTGARIIVPALRNLGVRRVDTVIVSHANLDHFSAMIEIVDSFGADELLVTPHFLGTASDVQRPEAALLASLRESGVTITTVRAGDHRTIGDMTLDWLHPPADQSYERINDTAAVIRITCAGRRVLLCGDIQAQAMEDLLTAHDPAALAADVMELPHHGAFHDTAVDFVRAVDPDIVLQSTGFGRLRRDRWAAELADTERLITARDGACWVEIARDGSLATGTWKSASAAATPGNQGN